MSQQLIKQLIERKVTTDGMIESGIIGVQFFKVTEPIYCAPAIYKPSITAIVSGKKEAIWDGKREVYDNNQYICCTMSMPVEAGTPEASLDNPLLGVYITLDTRAMTELTIEMENSPVLNRQTKSAAVSKGFSLSRWDDKFSDALYRLLQLGEENPLDIAILSKSRLRELYYTILQGDSGDAVKGAFGVGNEIARSIEFLSANLNESITIEDMATQIGMSRAVFHRKFKQATNLSPIQFVKTMRLNHAAMKIAEGTHVNVAALDVGYMSSSQFSREFKRMFGQSPKKWVHTHQIPSPISK